MMEVHPSAKNTPSLVVKKAMVPAMRVSAAPVVAYSQKSGQVIFLPVFLCHSLIPIAVAGMMSRKMVAKMHPVVKMIVI